jgi:hypothetical protein
MIKHVSECDYLGITDGRWKYIWYPEGGIEHLFNLESDPKELKNLAYTPQFDEKRKELQNIMIKRHEARSSEFVKNGKLITFPVNRIPEAELRDKSWPGYHTDYCGIDARH